jgi:hypothetical protein
VGSEHLRARPAWRSSRSRRISSSRCSRHRYSHQFFLDELIRVEELKSAGARAAGGDRAEGAHRFRMDLPPVRKGKAGELLRRGAVATHNRS